MKNIGLILTKELRSYFDSPIAYIFIIIFLLLSGTYFIGNLFPQNEASLRSLFEAIPILLLFFAPAITMRLISEEKKSGTFEILGTKSIRTGEIVLGKFLAAWILVLIALIPTLCYLVTVIMLGPVDLGPVVGGYCGVLVLGGAFVAIGILGSACSENQIVAFIISFATGLILFVVDRILIYVPLGFVRFVEYLGIEHHFSSLARGVLDSRDIVYFVSLIALSLLIATVLAGTETLRSVWKLRELSWKEQALRIVLLLGIVFFANILSLGFFVRVDLTKNKAFTLTDQTKHLIASLDDNLLVTAYFSPDLPPPYHNHRRAVQELLDEYRAYAPGKFHYQFVNPLASPELEEQAREEGIMPVQVKVIKKDKFQTQKAYVGVAFAYGDGTTDLPVVSSLESLEYEISSSLKRLMSRQEKTIGFLSGQGEPGLDQMNGFRSSLSKDYNVTTVDLSSGNAMPGTIDALLVIAPQKRFSEATKFLLDQYIMRGGRVIFCVNTVVPDEQAKKAHHIDLNLDDMFDIYGWTVNTDLIEDARCAHLNAGEGGKSSMVDVMFPYYPVATDFNLNNPAVRGLSSVAFTYVSSVDTRLAGIRGANAEVVVSSSDKSRRMQGEIFNVDPAQGFATESFDEQGIPFAATIEGKFKSLFAKRRVVLEEGSALSVDTSNALQLSSATKIVVVGDGDFILDRNLNGYDNISFATSLVGWLVDDNGLQAIPKREIAVQQLNEVTDATKSLVKYINFAIPSGLVIVGGLFRMAARTARRRKHQSNL